VEGNGIGNGTVHGEAIVFGEVTKAHDVCNPIWIVPYGSGIFTEVALLSQGDRSGIAVEVQRGDRVMNVMQQLGR
jgi:hypothetical protein